MATCGRVHFTPRSSGNSVLETFVGNTRMLHMSTQRAPPGDHLKVHTRQIADMFSVPHAVTSLSIGTCQIAVDLIVTLLNSFPSLTHLTFHEEVPSKGDRRWTLDVIDLLCTRFAPAYRQYPLEDVFLHSFSLFLRAGTDGHRDRKDPETKRDRRPIDLGTIRRGTRDARVLQTHHRLLEKENHALTPSSRSVHMHRGIRSYNCGRRLDAGHHISARAAIGEWLWDTGRTTTRQSSIVTSLLMVMPHTRSFYPYMMPTCFIFRAARAFLYHGHAGSGQLIRYTPRWEMIRAIEFVPPCPTDQIKEMARGQRTLSVYNMIIAPGHAVHVGV